MPKQDSDSKGPTKYTPPKGVAMESRMKILNVIELHTKFSNVQKEKKYCLVICRWPCAKSPHSYSDAGLICVARTANKITAPPRNVVFAGISAKNIHPNKGASGVSRALNSAVSPAGIRFMPSARVTDAIAKISPKAALVKKS